MTVRLGPDGERVTAPPGTLVTLPPLVVHGFRNERDGELRYLNLHTPGVGFADYLRALRDGRPTDFDQEPPAAAAPRPAAAAAIGGRALLAAWGRMRAALLADLPEIGIAEVRAAPGGPVAAVHAHRRHDEWCYVLEGDIALVGGERELRATAGSWIHVPRGASHALSVRGTAPARVLSLHAPGCGFGAFLRALAEDGDEAAAAAHSGFDQVPAG